MFESSREQMIIDIEAGVSLSRHTTGRDHVDATVIDAMQRVQRELFVPENSRDAAFHDGALAIGHGQTISQPFIVALMTDMLEPHADQCVLEIGTGSGYQAAILSCLVHRVYSIERIEALAKSAAERLQRLGYDNVEVCCQDGFGGWPEKGPFDSIIVTAAAPSLPEELFNQLKPGGRLVAPIGQPRQTQQLKLFIKDDSGEIEARNLLRVAFVPMLEGVK